MICVYDSMSGGKWNTATPVRCSVSCTEMNDGFLTVMCKNTGCKLTDACFTFIYNMIKN